MALEKGDIITVNGEEYKILEAWEHGDGFVYQAQASDGTTRRVYSHEIDAAEGEPEGDTEPEEPSGGEENPPPAGDEEPPAGDEEPPAGDEEPPADE